ncbi:MAG: cation-translocating P-type ATPase [Symbiobacteriia bacterium]
MAEHPAERGLSQAEVQARLTQYGPNELSQERRWGFFTVLVSVLREPMFLLLLAAAGLYFLLGNAGEAATMLVFVLFVTGITIFQEWRTERALQALKDLSAPRATVIRDGEAQTIPSREVVPGDLLLLAEGERIAADADILQCSDLQVDESILTGESEAVWKVPVATAEPWRRDRVYAGTMALQGKALTHVIATGAQTEYGQIGKSLAELESRPTPLQVKTRRLVAGMGWLGLALFGGVVLLSAWRGHSWLESFVAGIALAMAMIPEEFPVVLTVFLALGAARLARRHALMRRVPSVETLGAATVLCVDKTGTLTQNRMTVRALVPAAGVQERDLARLAVLASETDPYDPMEQAIYAMAGHHGLDAPALHREAALLHEYSFHSDTKRMAHLWQVGEEVLLAAKGSPETLLPLCTLDPAAREHALHHAEVMAARGLRVLALAAARGITTPFAPDLSDYRLEFAGLLGLADPPREGAADAVAECRRAGIRVVMISGDHAATARAIGREVGLNHEGRALTGEAVDAMSDDELMAAVGEVDIFARVVPAHKLRIVQALRRRGEVVGMTGDGVNDAPALKEADIGVAMGQRGTEVARQAADMILLNDDFATIVHSIADGRRIYDNIKKAIAYIIAVHIPIAGLALLAPLLGLPLLLLPVHIVLLELILDPTCSIVFEAEPAEANLMTRPPRHPADPLLDWRMGLQVAIQGASILAASFLSYFLLLRSSAALPVARSFALVVLVLGNILLVLVSRSYHQPVWRTLGGVNYARYWVNGLATLAVVAAIYVPFLQRPFGTVALPLQMFLEAAGLAVLAIFWWELVKPLLWDSRKA